MGWYVFALIDAMPSGAPRRGLSGPLGVRRHAGVLAVVERRADVPPAEFGTLKKHQAIVSAFAARVPAILPVRFGTLLEDEEIDEALEGRHEEIEEAFLLVRDRVQFTWRRTRRFPRGARNTMRKRSTAPPTAAAGTAYLQQAARDAHPRPPAAFRALHRSLAGLIAQQRYEPATVALPESLYHLVDKTAVPRYRRAAQAALRATPALRMTGPWPPFAFVPEVL
jgi:Gas vesicle synthesis protein GvpL/GvpF